MAKVVKKAASGPPQKSKVYGYPSRFGSHSSMVKPGHNDGDFCVCVDEYGEYVTNSNRLDTGLADPNRYSITRLGKLFEKTVKEE